MNSAINEYKPLGQNPFEKYIGTVVKVQVTEDRKGLTGCVTAVLGGFLEVEHLDGRRTLIKIDQIVFLSPIRKPREAPQ